MNTVDLIFRVVLQEDGLRRGFIIDELEDTDILNQYFRNYDVQKYITKENSLVDEENGNIPIKIKE